MALSEFQSSILGNVAKSGMRGKYHASIIVPS